MIDNKIRSIAIYLPQFHPIPENNEWWGNGFTEWTNVVRAQPRFQGHYQPHFPANLGFYDLRLEEARLAQEAIAKIFGIYGFCYYHYWFNGKRLLNEPIDRKLKNPKEDLPFMLCWANENWTRAWDGGESEILLEQKYSQSDDIEHIKFLIPLFKDERYIKVNGKPVFIIYKPSLFPSISNTINIFREEALKHGIELYMCRFERWNGWTGEGFDGVGFDAAIEFQPLSKSLNEFIKNNKNKKSLIYKLVDTDFYKNQIKKISRKNIYDNIIDYSQFIDFDIIKYKKKENNYKLYPGVSPMWDNSSRRINQNALIFKNSTPEKFYYWVSNKLKNFKPFSQDENFLFINAWNEWAEGNHLEPCLKWGTKYLEMLKLALDENNSYDEV
jgi:lipopolysaccharide biosynthesis protein